MVHLKMTSSSSLTARPSRTEMGYLLGYDTSCSFVWNVPLSRSNRWTES